MRLFIMSLVFSVFLAVTQVANATVLVEGTGTWSSIENGLTSTYGNQGTNWTFSFDLPNPITANPTIQATNFTSTFASSSSSPPIPVSLAETSGTVNITNGPSINGNQITTYNYRGGVWFNPDSLYYLGGTVSQTGSQENGLSMNLCENTGCPGVDALYITGANLFSNGSTLTLGTFSNMSVSLDAGGALGSATVTVSTITGNGSGGVSATPEPSTIALFGTGILLMGGLALKKKGLLNRA